MKMKNEDGSGAQMPVPQIRGRFGTLNWLGNILDKLLVEFGSCERGLTVVTTEGDEVRLAGFLKGPYTRGRTLHPRQYSG